MNRGEALKLIHQYVKNENSLKHMLATEAIMKALANHFGESEEDKSSSSPFAIAREDEEIWGLAGLLHDLDMEIVDYKKNPEKQGVVGAEMLEKMGVDKVITEAIKAHNEATGKVRETRIEKAIFCTDPLTGLIVAATLVLPSKKLVDLTPQSVIRRFREKSFAKGANRQIISSCSEIGLSLEEFIKIGLEAMQKISNQLGL